jgi:uncharacterized membrane protein YdjX (TVP38/TMEM64 family)
VPEPRPARRWWVWLLVFVVLATVIVASIRWWQPVYGLLSQPDRFRTWVQSFGPWGPLVIFGLEFAQSLLAPIPSPGIEAVAGYLYGMGWGLVYSMSGIVVGSLVTFALSRRFGRPLATRLVGRGSMARIDDLVRRGGAPFFFIIWLVPFAPDDLACVAAGLTAMPTRQFVVLMTLGRLPGMFAAVWVGVYATRLHPVWWGVALATIGVLALFIWWKGDEFQEAVLSFAERVGHHLGR